MIKVTSGKYRSRNIFVPACLLVPSKSIVREALGNMTRDYVSSAVCLDLFGGSGSVGIEFLSNGASSCDFVERNPECYQAIKDNLESLKEKNAHVYLSEAIDFLKKTDIAYDLIFIDPPYADKEMYVESLEIIKERKLLNDGGTIILEYEGEIQAVESFTYLKEKKYGKTKLVVVRE